MSEAPFLVTERLELWLPRPGDLQPLYEVVSHPVTGRFLGPTAQLHEQAMRFMRSAGSWFLYGYGAFLLRLRGQEALIGNCGIFHTFRGLGDDFDDHPEAGWILRHDQIGKGLAGEAMRAALEWFEREHGPRRLVCMIDPQNAPSLHLAEKLGFVAMRDANLPDGERVRLLERIPG